VQTRVVGEGIINATALLELERAATLAAPATAIAIGATAGLTGATQAQSTPRTIEAAVPILPCRALWDAQGLRMALKDPRHPVAPIALLPAKVTLHAPSPA
jgi:hypothetical protein